MNASFDGMRRNATRSMNDLYRVVGEVMALKSFEEVSDDLKEELADRWNDAAMSVGFLNCLFDPDVEGDMTNLSDLMINTFEDG